MRDSSGYSNRFVVALRVGLFGAALVGAILAAALARSWSVLLLALSIIAGVTMQLLQERLGERDK